jgi:TonB family protein
MPVYRPEWAKQGLTGKGIVLVTIDKQTGKVTGARMLESTGSQLLDGAALQAYSQWRFKPGSVTQLKMPIEFKNRPPPTSARKASPARYYPLLIIFIVGATWMIARRRPRQPN